MQVYKNNVHQLQGVFPQKIKYLSLRNGSHIFKEVMEIVQIASNTLFTLPIGASDGMEKEINESDEMSLLIRITCVI